MVRSQSAMPFIAEMNALKKSLDIPQDIPVQNAVDTMSEQAYGTAVRRRSCGAAT